VITSHSARCMCRRKDSTFLDQALPEAILSLRNNGVHSLLTGLLARCITTRWWAYSFWIDFSSNPRICTAQTKHSVLFTDLWLLFNCN